MKIAYDKAGRKIYKFSHSVSKGGNLYSHKVREGIIENKEGLRNVLKALSIKFKLIDITIKVYDNIFLFYFLVPKSLAPATLIDFIQKNISSFGVWTEDYLYTGVYDLQENFIRKDFEKFGLDYDKG